MHFALLQKVAIFKDTNICKYANSVSTSSVFLNLHHHLWFSIFLLYVLNYEFKQINKFRLRVSINDTLRNPRNLWFFKNKLLYRLNAAKAQIITGRKIIICSIFCIKRAKQIYQIATHGLQPKLKVGCQLLPHFHYFYRQQFCWKNHCEYFALNFR